MFMTFDDTFSVIEKSFSVIGLREIYKSSKMQRFHTVMYTLGFIHLAILTTLEFVYFLKLMTSSSNNKFLTAAELLPCVTVSVFGLYKSMNLVAKREKLIQLVEDLRMLWPREIDQEVRDIVQQSMTPTRQFTLVYSIVTNVLSMTYNIFPMFLMLLNYLKNGHTITLFPYYIWYPVDLSAFSFKYIVFYISQCYAGIFVTCALSSVDCLFCLIIAQVCMQLQLLAREITNAAISQKAENRQNQVSVKDKLKRVIEYHNKLLLMGKAIERIFSLVLLINLVFSSLIICVVLFSISIAPPGLLVKYCIFLSSSMTQILMMSWYGNKLVEESDNVFKAAFYSKWTDLETVADRKVFRYGIMMIQYRCQSPITISAMGFANVSMSTFSSIMSASWSYFTLLRTVYQRVDEDKK